VFEYAAVVQQEDLAGALDGGQAVGDHDGRGGWIKPQAVS
jgi:hypothetical protein